MQRGKNNSEVYNTCMVERFISYRLYHHLKLHNVVIASYAVEPVAIVLMLWDLLQVY